MLRTVTTPQLLRDCLRNNRVYSPVLVTKVHISRGISGALYRRSQNPQSGSQIPEYRDFLWKTLSIPVENIISTCGTFVESVGKIPSKDKNFEVSSPAK